MLRDCPNCKNKCINPLAFDKMQSYQCPTCHYYVFVPTIFTFFVALFLSSSWIVTLFGYELIFDRIFPHFSSFVLLVVFIYWLFGHKLDAMILPLRAKEHIDD